MCQIQRSDFDCNLPGSVVLRSCAGSDDDAILKIIRIPPGLEILRFKSSKFIVYRACISTFKKKYMLNLV